MVEHLFCKQKVIGSSPIVGSNKTVKNLNQRDLLDKVLSKGYKINLEGKVFNNNREILGTLGRYKYFTIRLNGKTNTKVKFHRLQAYVKYGEKLFEEGIEVRHFNGDNFDNSWDNILIGSHSDNMMDKPKDTRVRQASHPIYDHNKVQQDIKEGLSSKAIMEKYGIKSKGTLSYIKNKN